MQRLLTFALHMRQILLLQLFIPLSLSALGMEGVVVDVIVFTEHGIMLLDQHIVLTFIVFAPFSHVDLVQFSLVLQFNVLPHRKLGVLGVLFVVASCVVAVDTLTPHFVFLFVLFGQALVLMELGWKFSD